MKDRKTTNKTSEVFPNNGVNRQVSMCTNPSGWIDPKLHTCEN